MQGKNPFGDYGAQSGEIVGMLKAMKDEMDKDLGGAVATEEEAVKAFAAMSDAKKSEIAAAGEAIESKSVRSGAPGGVQMEIGEMGSGRGSILCGARSLGRRALLVSYIYQNLPD